MPSAATTATCTSSTARICSTAEATRGCARGQAFLGSLRLANPAETTEPRGQPRTHQGQQTSSQSPLSQNAARLLMCAHASPEPAAAMRDVAEQLSDGFDWPPQPSNKTHSMNHAGDTHPMKMGFFSYLFTFDLFPFALYSLPSTFHISPLNFHLSPWTFHHSPITWYLSLLNS